MLTFVICLSYPLYIGGAAGVGWVAHALAEAMEGFAPSSQTNAACNLHSRLYLEALSNSTLWAVQSK